MRDGAGPEAGSLLRRAAQQNPADFQTALAWAEYLDHYRQPGAVEAYAKAASLAADPSSRRTIDQRIQILKLAAATPRAERPRGSAAWTTVAIPGPLRSFSRMAALSPDLPPDQLLSALARNIVTNGYQASGGEEGLVQTEYLKLVYRYLSQARELQKLAGDDQRIDIPQCDAPGTGELLKVIGYRIRGACGSDVVLETVNAGRAFLTIDSGFPIAELERSLRLGQPFQYDFRPAQVPVMFDTAFWLAESKDPKAEFIDQFMADPQMCRLYLGLSKLDGETAEALRKGIQGPKLRAFAHVLDFYGGMFEIRDGKAIIPGGPKAVRAWTEIVGAPADNGVAFFEKLLQRDDGWLASYYDAVARIEGPLKDYLNDPDRVKRYYTAIRGRVTSPGPARPVFRANTDMLMFTTRLRLDADGRPHIPGNLESWRNLFIRHPHGRYDGKLTKAASGWREPDDLIEALFALTRKVVDNEPLKIFLALSDVNRKRPQPLQVATTDRLILDHKKYGAQYPVLSEFPLSDATIVKFLDIAAEVDKVRDVMQRSDAAGISQGLIGLWQIAARQGLLQGQEDATLARILGGLTGLDQPATLFDAGRKGLEVIATATGAKSTSMQENLLDLLSGKLKGKSEAQQTLRTSVERLFEQQRLVSMDTLFELDDDLEGVAKGQKFNAPLANKLAARISEINLPRPALSSAERNSLAFGYYTERHIEDQRRFNLRQKIDKAGVDAAKLGSLRGELTPILRDSILGCNYLYYAPPGAQILLTNPLFVRSHDFVGMLGNAATWRNTEVYGSGWPSSAGGRLSGSLVNLPYALAEAEQNFLVPEREQALIWGDLVPQILISAKVPRWWTVTRAQMHFVSLALLHGEEILGEATLLTDQREAILADYARLASPVHVDRVRKAMMEGDLASALFDVQPSELYLLGTRAAASRRTRLASELRAMQQAHPKDLSAEAISRAFGTPKPTLLHNYGPELLGLRTFPTMMGYSSRIMAESWESNVLYFAALADELNVEPSQLNVLVPEWTQKTIERIFATHLEDWPALLRSLKHVADQARKGAPPASASAGGMQ
jgi:hypothetical protein